jgi:hypothetical protein
VEGVNGVVGPGGAPDGIIAGGAGYWDEDGPGSRLAAEGPPSIDDIDMLLLLTLLGRCMDESAGRSRFVEKDAGGPIAGAGCLDGGGGGGGYACG